MALLKLQLSDKAAGYDTPMDAVYDHWQFLLPALIATNCLDLFFRLKFPQS